MEAAGREGGGSGGEGKSGDVGPPQRKREGSTSPSAAASASATNPNNKAPRTHGERWEESFHRLAAFQKKHGHCNIPYRYEEDPFLGRWVSLQRSIYKSEAAAYAAAASGQPPPSATSSGDGDAAEAKAAANPTNKEQQKSRIERLNEIGFDWNPQETRHVSWEQRYGELRDFVARNGHARVPLGWKENIQLAHWVSAQRREYKLLRKGLPSRLTRDRLQKLEKINFLWRAGRGGPRVPSSGRDPVEPLPRDGAAGGARDDDPSGGAEGIAPPHAQPAAAQGPNALATNASGAAGVGPGYTLPPGTAFLLTNAGAFPAILAQPSALAPLQGLAQQQQAVAPTIGDPTQASNTTTAAAAAAAAATVLNLFPILAQTAAATAAVSAAAPMTSLAAGAPATVTAEDPSVAALRLLMNAGVVAAPGVGAGAGTTTGTSSAAPAAALVIPQLSSAYGTAPGPAGAIAPAPGPAPVAALAPAALAPGLDPQTAMNLALTLQLLTRAQAAGAAVQPPQQQPAAPSMNAADGTGTEHKTEPSSR